MSHQGRPGPLGWWRVGVAILRRPDLWATTLVQARRLTPPGWARRRPWLPWPPAAYVRFRLLTQYGAADAVPAPDDVVTYLGWCRQVRAAQRGGARWQDGRR